MWYQLHDCYVLLHDFELQDEKYLVLACFNAAAGTGTIYGTTGTAAQRAIQVSAPPPYSSADAL